MVQIPPPAEKTCTSQSDRTPSTPTICTNTNWPVSGLAHWNVLVSASPAPIKYFFFYSTFNYFI